VDSWKDGNLEDGKGGKAERWKGGKVERWKGGKVERWKGGKVERWKGGKVERLNGGMMDSLKRWTVKMWVDGKEINSKEEGWIRGKVESLKEKMQKRKFLSCKSGKEKRRIGGKEERCGR
jgi:hypothetical protein